MKPITESKSEEMTERRNIDWESCEESAVETADDASGLSKATPGHAERSTYAPIVSWLSFPSAKSEHTASDGAPGED